MRLLCYFVQRPWHTSQCEVAEVVVTHARRFRWDVSVELFCTCRWWCTFHSQCVHCYITHYRTFDGMEKKLLDLKSLLFPRSLHQIKHHVSTTPGTMARELLLLTTVVFYSFAVILSECWRMNKQHHAIVSAVHRHSALLNLPEISRMLLLLFFLDFSHSKPIQHLACMLFCNPQALLFLLYRLPSC